MPADVVHSSANGERVAPTLRVGGLTRFTSIDFPGEVAAVVFAQGCPWRCRYCHNPHLQPRKTNAGAKHWHEVLAWLRTRVGLLDGVVFSGGEPTMDPGLASAVRDVRSLGLKVALHTAGMYPRRLAVVLPLLDWIGLDVKAPLSDEQLHDHVTGVQGGQDAMRRSLSLAVESKVPLEVRTTIHPELHNEAAILTLAKELLAFGVTRYILQVARPVSHSEQELPRIASRYPSDGLVARLRGEFADFKVRAA